jgi:hypothetical protein
MKHMRTKFTGRPFDRIFTIGLWMTLLMSLPMSAPAATLADLFNGGFIDAANTRFSNWQLISLDATALPAPQLAQIIVTPLVNDITKPGLSFAANGQLAITGINAIDLTFTYRVQALPNSKSYVGQSLNMTGPTFGGTAGIVQLTQEVADLGGSDLGATLAMADMQSGFSQLTSDAAHPFRFGLKVNTSIFVTGISAADTVSLTSFTQRFTQTGPQSLAGDFDVDGDVDGRDFLIWQRGGSPNPLSATNLASWRANYGTVTALGATMAAIPEPTTASLAILLAVASLWHRARF